MAYGYECRVCGGTVDNNEYDFVTDMCKECAIEQEQRAIRSAEVTRILKMECRQMRLEDLVSGGY